MSDEGEPALTPAEIRCIDAEADEHTALAEKARAEARHENARAALLEDQLTREKAKRNTVGFIDKAGK